MEENKIGMRSMSKAEMEVYKAEVEESLYQSDRFTRLRGSKKSHSKLEPEPSIIPVVVLDSEAPETSQAENNMASVIANTEELSTSGDGVAHPVTLEGKNPPVKETNCVLNEERESTLKATTLAKKTATKRRPGPKSKTQVGYITDIKTADHQDGAGMASKPQGQGKASKISKKDEDAPVSQPDGETSTGETSTGETSTGETSTGETSTGETSTGESSLT